MKHARFMDRPNFFFFVRAVLPESPPKPGPGRAREVGGRVSQKALAVPGLNVQNGRGGLESRLDTTFQIGQRLDV